MPIFVAALLGGLLQVLGSVVGRVMLAIGLGYASYTGLSTLLTWAKSNIESNIGALGSVAVGILGTLKVDVAISIIFSAMTIRLVLKGLTSDSMKKIIVK